MAMAVVGKPTIMFLYRLCNEYTSMVPTSSPNDRTISKAVATVFRQHAHTQNHQGNYIADRGCGYFYSLDSFSSTRPSLRYSYIGLHGHNLGIWARL